MKFTVLGATGFIGSNLITYLEDRNHVCCTPHKDACFTKDKNLGHVIYCIGLTSDFRTRHYETVNAHVIKLLELINTASFDSLLYLSSTRVYNGSHSSEEESKLTVAPNCSEDLYNISKLMGESICLSNTNDKIRVVRLSNVIGNDFNSDNFVFSLIKEAVNENKITLHQSSQISRDYILIDDVLEGLYNISKNGTERIYNLASGKNVSNKEIIHEISNITNCQIYLANESKTVNFPQISIRRIKEEFSFDANDLTGQIRELIQHYKKLRS